MNSIIELWKKRIEPFFMRCLEDYQIMLPLMPTISDDKMYLLCLVGTYNDNSSVFSVSQRHIWNYSGHKFSICNKMYKVEKNDLIYACGDDYKSRNFRHVDSIFRLFDSDWDCSDARKAFDEFTSFLQTSNSIYNVLSDLNREFFEWIEKIY